MTCMSAKESRDIESKTTDSKNFTPHCSEIVLPELLVIRIRRFLTKFIVNISLLKFSLGMTQVQSVL